MEHQLTVVGIGPGSPDYILPAALEAIRRAPVLIGGGRALDAFARPGQQTFRVGGDIAALMRFIGEQLRLSDIVVMVSGDPGFYSLLATLRNEMPAQALRVIPGLSSFQVAFARIGIPWQTARLLSAHGRDPEPGDLVYGKGQLLSFLTDGKNIPSRIAGLLLGQHGWPAGSTVWLCRNLTYADETVLETTLEATLRAEGFENCVMVVKG